MRRLARSTARVVLLFSAISLISLAVLLGVARVGLPLVAGYKSDIEARLSDTLRSPLSIGELSLRWRGWGPQLHARNVAISESTNRQVRVDELLFDLNPWRSLLEGLPVARELTLVGAEFAIDYSRRDGVSLHGVMPRTTRTLGQRGEVDRSNATGGGIDVLGWLLTAGRVGLLDTRLHLTDTERQIDVTIDSLNVRAENRASLHQLRIDLELPESLGQRVEMGVDLTDLPPGTGIKRLAESAGNLYLRADSLQTGEIRTLIARLMNSPAQAAALLGRWPDLTADGAIEMWSRWHDGQLDQTRARIDLDDVRTAESGLVLFDRVSADLDLSLEAVAGEPGWRLDTPEIRLVRDGESASIAPLSLSHRADGLRLELAAEILPLSMLAPYAATLASRYWQNLPAEWLADAHPSGNLQSVALSLQRTGDTLHVATARGRLEAGFAAAGEFPGIDALSAEFDINNDQGQLLIDVEDASIDWPSVYPDGLALDHLHADLAVALGSDSVRFAGAPGDRSDLGAQLAGQLSVALGSAEVSTRVSISRVAGRAPHIDAQGRFEVADLAALRAALPLPLMRPGAARWWESALQGGRADNGSLLLFGYLDEFPFDHREGVFRASADVHDGQLQFLRNWPVIENLQGRIDLEGASFAAEVSAGRLDALALSGATVRIDDLTAPVLALDGHGRGPLPGLLHFGRTGPLARWLATPLSPLEGQGEAELDLALRAPLRKPPAGADGQAGVPRVTFNGTLFLDGNTVAIPTAKLRFTAARGGIGFSNSGVRIDTLRARLLGAAVRLTASTANSGDDGRRETRFGLRGVLEASDLLAHYGIPLDTHVAGSSSWQADLRIPHSAPGDAAAVPISLRLDSDLVGTLLRFGDPLSKASDRARAMRIEMAFLPGEASREWYVYSDDGTSVRALVRDGRLAALNLAFGGSALNRQLTEGVRIDGTTARIDTRPVILNLLRMLDGLPARPGSRPMPVSADLRTDSLIVGSDTLGAARVRVSRDQDFLNVVLDNRHIAGSLRYPHADRRDRLAARVRVSQLRRDLILALSTLSERDADDEAAGEALDPRGLPAFDIRVASLDWGDLSLRDLVMRTRPDATGLRVDALGFAHRTTQLVGEGYWRLRDPQAANPILTGQHTTSLSLLLQTENLGQGLSDMGLEGLIDEGQGTITATLGWRGPLYQPAIAALQGEMSLQLSEGRILSVDPGAARIMGLFALQTIPRRLSLDFKDLVKDGLDFDTVTGSVSLANGVADTALLQLNGPIGVVDVTGQSDLLLQTYDQYITVLPRVSAALPIIGVISGGASAGVGALVAGGFLKAMGVDFDRIGLREYRMRGPWKAPEITAVPVDEMRAR